MLARKQEQFILGITADIGRSIIKSIASGALHKHTDDNLYVKVHCASRFSWYNVPFIVVRHPYDIETTRSWLLMARGVWLPMHNV